MSAYVVFTRIRTNDQGEMDVYAPLAGATLQQHPATPVAFYGDLTVLEGDPIEGAAIVEFPTIEAARAWYDSPAYQEALKHRQAGADYRVFLVDGVA